MRVGIISFQHESNTFLPTPTTLADFQRDALLTGSDIARHYAESHHEIGGFLQGLEQNGITAVPLLAAWAVPSGPVADECYRTILAMIRSQLAAAGALDGLLVAPHGAGVSELHTDMDGHWLSAIRAQVGADLPIVSTLDLHANVSPRMIDSVNATIAYRTNPHLDQRQCGIDAANLIARTLRKEIWPTQAAAFPPLAINIERQLTAAPPCSQLFALANSQLRRGAISNSCLLGFPYADVPKMGCSFIAVTDNNPSLARQLADELASHVFNHREDFLPHLISIDKAIDDAMQSPGPVTLLDIGDNIGAGAPGNATHLLHALHTRKIASSFLSLYDPISVQNALASGIGQSAAFSLGNKNSSDLLGPPLNCSCTIRSLHPGQFTENEARHGGRKNFDMGQTAIVITDTGMTIQLTSRRIPPFSLNQIISCGLNPCSFHLLIAKGVHAPAAAYGPISKKLIRVNTPGLTTADLHLLAYHHRRHPLYPFEEIEKDRDKGQQKDATP